MVKAAPWPGSLSTEIDPPSLRMISWDIANPSPVPGIL
jgi:hypothetical protein